MVPDLLVAELDSCFGCSPTAVVRSPGRVNLIGEHTDYSDLPVLPMAMDRATWLAVAPTSDNRVVARSLCFDGEADLVRSDLERGITAPWQRYVVGALRLLEGAAPGRGARLVVGGDLPTTGGLSSSSSLSMGLLAALDRAWELGRDLRALVELATVAERHVGVESGGMDQTVIAHARAGAALRIDFAPTRIRAVPLPGDMCVVVAYSGQEAEKGGAVRQAYKERVIGCRLASALLGVPVGDRPPTLGRAVAVSRPLPAVASAEEVARQLDCPVEPLVRLTAGRFDPAAFVPIKPVARHVLSEARRVDRAEAALVTGDLPRFGELLNASHRSLAGDYRCSTDALDHLCQAMREAGALGARLTGAGFGGPALAVVRPGELERVLAAARRVVPGPVFETHAAAGLSVEAGS